MRLGKTKAELLRDADSAELTEWQAYLTALAQEERDKDGRRIQWNTTTDDDD